MTPQTEPKTVTVTVNTRPREVEKNIDLGFTDVVALAYPNPVFSDTIEYTVAWRREPGNQTGSLVQGGKTIKAKEGLIFDVTKTDKS